MLSLSNHVTISYQHFHTICIYRQLVVIQTTFNAILAYAVYNILVAKPAQSSSKTAAATSTTISQWQLLFTYGIAIPLVMMEPIYVMEYLDIKNVGLGMAFLATPINLSLRIAEGNNKKKCYSILLLCVSSVIYLSHFKNLSYILGGSDGGLELLISRSSTSYISYKQSIIWICTKTHET